LVSKAIKARGYVPRVASDRRYYGQLRDNVEFFILGCAKAVGIIENQDKPELNLNVALESSWMRAMGREVL
jgi:hypothetical protein